MFNHDKTLFASHNVGLRGHVTEHCPPNIFAREKEQKECFTALFQERRLAHTRFFIRNLPRGLVLKSFLFLGLFWGNCSSKSSLIVP